LVKEENWNHSPLITEPGKTSLWGPMISSRDFGEIKSLPTLLLLFISNMEQEHKEDGPLPPIIVLEVLPTPPKSTLNIPLQKTILLNRLNQDARDLIVPKSASAIAIRPKQFATSAAQLQIPKGVSVRRVKSESELKHSWDYSLYINFNSKNYKDSPTSNADNANSCTIPKVNPEPDSTSSQLKPNRPQHISLNLNAIPRNIEDEFSTVALTRSGFSQTKPDKTKQKSTWRKSLKKDKEAKLSLPKVEENSPTDGHSSMKGSKSDFVLPYVQTKPEIIFNTRILTH